MNEQYRKNEMINLFKCECLAINWEITSYNNKLCLSCNSCGNKYFKHKLNIYFKKGVQELINQVEFDKKWFFYIF